MKKFAKIMMITACVFLALGIGFSAAGAAMGASAKDMDLSDDFRDGMQIMRNIVVSNGDHDAESSGSGTDGTDAFPADVVERMEFELCSDELILREYEGDKIMIEVEDEDTDDVKINASSSEVKIKTTKSKNNRCIIVSYPKSKHFREMEIDVDAGSVCVEDSLSADKIEVKIGAGEFMNDSVISAEELNVEVGAGSAEITELTAKKIDGECSLGSLVLGICGEEDDYSYNLECGIGEININGESYGGFAREKKITNPGATGEIDLECGVGEIELSFE